MASDVHYNLPDIREDQEVFTVALVHIQVGLSQANCQVYEPRLIHISAFIRTHTSTWVLTPVYNYSARTYSDHYDT